MANYPYYGQYFPMQYNAFPTQANVGATQQTQTPGITWVQGESGAKSYLVGAGQSVLLMDSEDSVFYIKSTDGSGMPMPLRVFDYTERKAPGTDQKNPVMDMSEYLTRDEFKKWTEQFAEKMKGADDDGEKPFV